MMKEFWEKANEPGSTMTITKAQVMVIYDALDSIYRAKAFDALPFSVRDRILKALGK